MTDVEFMLSELGMKFRPTTEAQEKSLEVMFDHMPYPLFVEIAKLQKKLENSPLRHFCEHCKCACAACAHGGCGIANSYTPLGMDQPPLPPR